jgi:hypothetical protein
MPEFIRLLSELREHMSAELTRSDVLRALIWPIAGLLLALGTLAGRVAPWIITDLFMLLCGFLGLYALIYVVCFFLDRDALRSEKYKLHKMAIERGLYGDSKTGLIDIPNAQITSDTKAIEAPAKREIGRG